MRTPVTPSIGQAAARPVAGRFQGWRILAVSIVTVVLTGPGQTIGVSVFIDPMVDALGVSRSTVSTAYLIGTLVGASAMPRFGLFVDGRGVRRAQVVVGLLFTLALVNMAGVQNAIWLAVGFAGIRMMGQGALSMIPTVAVSLWFQRRRGLAMGILTTVGGAGMVAVPVLLDAAISATSWRTAWLIAAAVVFVTVVPLGWFALIDRPDTAAGHPDAAVDAIGGTVRSAGEAPSFTRAEAVRTRQFWILASVSTITGMLVTGLNFHQIDLLAEAGLSSGRAAAMFLPQVVGSSVTALGVGYVMDRIGVRYVPSVAVLLLVVVHLIAAAMQPGLIVFAYAIALGATGGATRAALSTMVPGYFGTDHVGSIQGVMTVTGVAGSAAGPVTLALVEGWLGSYTAANLLLAAIPVVAFLFTLTNRRPVAIEESKTGPALT